jgi:hypothetical protein
MISEENTITISKTWYSRNNIMSSQKPSLMVNILK